MSRHNRPAPANPNLAGADLVAQRIKGLLTPLQFVDAAGSAASYFAEADRIYLTCEVRTQNERPVLKVSPRLSIPLTPDGVQRSLAFFYVHDPVRLDVGDAVVRYDLSLIVAYSEARIGNPSYRIKENFIAEVRKALQTETKYEALQEFRDKRQVFEPFSLAYNAEWGGEDFDAFRLRFVAYGDVCSTPLDFSL